MPNRDRKARNAAFGLKREQPLGSLGDPRITLWHGGGRGRLKRKRSPRERRSKG